MARYLDEEITPKLTDIDFKRRILKNPADADIPFLFAERVEAPAFKTVLIYGHGGVIRAQTEQWRNGLDPGRGTADNKGQHCINIAKSLKVTGRFH